MPKGEQRGSREKKKPKKDKSAKHVTSYAAQYSKQQPTHITATTTPSKKP